MDQVNTTQRIEELTLLRGTQDKWFKRFMFASVSLILVAVAILLSLEYRQLVEQQKDVSATRQYIQCIASFFAQPDRANKVLTNLNRCDVQNIR